MHTKYPVAALVVTAMAAGALWGTRAAVADTGAQDVVAAPAAAASSTAAAPATAGESTDAAAAPAPPQTVEQRIDALQQELTDLKGQLAAQQGKLEGCCPDQPKDACGNPLPKIDSGIYGDVYLQWQNRQTHHAAAPVTNYSDLRLYWAELGYNASSNDWSGHFSWLLDDNTNSVLLHEAWAKYQQKDKPWFFQAGRILVPFGNNNYYHATYPAVNDLGYSRLRAVGGGWDNGKSDISAYVYNPPVDVAGQSDVVRDYTIVWDPTKRAVDACHDGWKFTLGYNSNLAAHDLRLSGADPLTKRVAGANVFGQYDFHSGDCTVVHVLADYTQALGRYAPADLDANGDGVGDRPAALNTELVIEPKTDTLWGVSYQNTQEMKDYAGTRYGALYSRRLNKLAKFKLEYTHGIYNSYATGGQTKDDTLVGEIHLTF
jgi:hypothetical protein